MAVLRDPVERVVSHYYHYLQVVDPNKSSRPAEERRLIERDNVTLEDWAFDLRRIEADNQLVRHICGMREVPYGACTDEMLTVALDNIEEHFELVMFAEAMTADTRRLGYRLGYAISPDVRANVNEHRPTVDELDPRVVARIRELNRFDVALYERMRERRAAGHNGGRLPWA